MQPKTRSCSGCFSTPTEDEPPAHLLSLLHSLKLHSTKQLCVPPYHALVLCKTKNQHGERDKHIHTLVTSGLPARRALV